MPRILQNTAVSTSLAFALLCCSFLQAQQPTAPPPAPVPTQIVTGKKVFVSNALGESITPLGSAELNYNQFYTSMKSWGRYELVSAPADADLVFEIRYETLFGPVHDGFSEQYPQIRLTILDPRTRIVLWAFTEPVRAFAKKSTGLQNYQHAMDTLLGELKTLTAPPV
jgi:hypothetical protein